MLRKKILTLASTSVLATALTVAAFAGGPSMEPMPAQSESGFTLGTSYTNQINSNFALMVGYVNDNFLADFGGSYNQYSWSTFTKNAWELRGDLGLRNSLTDTLYFTYGATGSYFVLTNKTSATKSPWAAGAFIGLDYQPLTHLLLSFKVDPYLYSSRPTNRTGGHTQSNNVFANGSIGASYIFS